MYLLSLTVIIEVSLTILTHDFGNVVKENKHTNYFNIINTTTNLVKITKIRSLCSCVKSINYTSEIQSMQTGTVALVLETAKLRGKVYYKTMVHINNQSRPSYQLDIRASIVDPIKINPRVIDIGRLLPTNIPTKKTFKIISRQNDEIDKPVFKNIPEWLDIIPRKEGKNWVVDLRFVNQLPIGRINTAITFCLGKKTNDIYTVKIKAHVKPIYSIQPALIPLGKIMKGDKIQKKITISSFDYRPVNIQKIMHTNENIRIVDISTNKNGNIYAQVLIIPGKEGIIDQNIIFTLDDPLQNSVNTRILGSCVTHKH